MINLLDNSSIAIIGGGRFCLALLKAIYSDHFPVKRPEVLGVADVNPQAVGLNFAREKGIFTTDDYRELLKLTHLRLVIEVTKDTTLVESIQQFKPTGLQLLDHFEARALLEHIKIETKKQELSAQLQKQAAECLDAKALFEHFYDFILDLSMERNEYSQEIRKGMLSTERFMAQIIQGSSIPTFVINQDHTVTHWNKACERLTGYAADDIVGTNHQWKPFRAKPRPIMADLILDGVSEEEVWRYYGTKWRRSELIDGAYEAEEYFGHLGENGKWLYFTAAPIKSSDGDIVGAIETLWDRTEEKITEKERINHNEALRLKAEELEASRQATSQIIRGSTVPTFVLDNAHRITHWNKAMERLTGYPAGEMIGTDKQWVPFWDEQRPSMADVILDQKSDHEIKELYGTKWRKSALIDDGYEAEVFFPKLGQNGKWCFFTAAPIRAGNGKILGAIETLWDKTEEKKAEQEREKNHRELASSEKRLSQIVQGSTIPTFVIDRHHRITHWNRACEKLTGFAAQDLIGTHDQWKPFRSKERPVMADLILKGVSVEEVWRYYGTKWKKSELIDGGYEAEEYFAHLGENGKWLYFTAGPIRDADGTIVGAIETLWDKTEEKNAIIEQDRHTKELATLCSVYATLSAPLDIHGRINAAIQEVTNIFSFDCICIFINEPDNTFQLKYSYGHSNFVCEQNKIADPSSYIFKVAEVGRFECIEDISTSEAVLESDLLTSDGLKSVAYIPVLDREKKTIGVIRAGSRSIKAFTTQEKHVLELLGNRIGAALENSALQDEVKRRASFQAKLINSSYSGIVATDEQWKIVIFNPEAERLFGYAASELLAKIDARTLYPKRVVQSIDDKSQHTGLKARVAWEEVTLQSKAGATIPVRFSATPLFKEGRMMGSVAFFQDLTEIKRLERELVQSERLAAIGQTVAGMAHGIKNILNGFKGGRYLVDIGIDKNNADKLKSGWEMIKRNIDRTSELVLDLLSYSKEREPEFEDCRPNAIAEDVIEVLRENAEDYEVSIEKDFSPDVGRTAMDPRTVHRALLNLVSNAIDACIFDDSIDKDHRVVVRTALENDRVMRLEVKDNGSGMSEAVQQKIFSSFFSTKGAKGTGLGLLVTKKLVEEHGGTIEVSSTLGKGTTFVIRLPFQPVE